ncbi:MAG: hypothetical protein ABJN40_18100 [Sneathiella sp.]
METPDLLIIGGEQDPNLGLLLAAAQKAGCAAEILSYGDKAEPSVTWEPGQNYLSIREREIRPKAIFIRHDVFSFGSEAKDDGIDKSLAWHTLATGYSLSNPTVRIFNRSMDWRSSIKPFMLVQAAKHGLKIPNTIVSNHQDAVEQHRKKFSCIAKPVAGGAYCQDLDDILTDDIWKEGVAPAPALIQNQLIYPEYRVFVIGQELILFKVNSDALDYRGDLQARLEFIYPTILPTKIRKNLLSLAQELGVDFGAADLKTAPDTGDLCFLELNNQPMFATYDAASNGSLCETMIKTLCINRIP